jgi:hypothetical protein
VPFTSVLDPRGILESVALVGEENDIPKLLELLEHWKLWPDILSVENYLKKSIAACITIFIKLQGLP